MLGGLAMVALEALFVVREVLLYVYMYGMPFGVAVAYGNVPILSTIARRLISQFIPLAVLPLPAAILFRGYELLFVGEQQLQLGGDFAQYLVVISLPVLALIATWKTFKFAAPLAARAMGTAGRGAVLAGTVVTAGYLAGPTAAAAGARWGPKAAVGSAVASTTLQSRSEASEQPPEDRPRGSEVGLPEYRRSENDPANNK
jgi:type IV secretion system protein TrbL